jgi:DNA invertase Pin-like site-specific DNA recombinase
MIFGYARVSTVQQSTNGNSMKDQVIQLEKEGCEIIVQEQFTGATTARPKFDELISKFSQVIN